MVLEDGKGTERLTKRLKDWETDSDFAILRTRSQGKGHGVT